MYSPIKKLLTRDWPFYAVVCLCLAWLPVPAAAQDAPLEISDLRLSNHTGGSFVVTWRTSRPTTVNQVLYGLDRSNLDKVADDKLAGGGVLHFVQLSFLDVDTTYYYRVRSDGLEFAVSPSGVDSVETFQQEIPQKAIHLVGRVTDQTGAPLENILVRSYLKWWKNTDWGTVYDSSMWYSVLSGEDGGFWMDVFNYRRYSGSQPQYIQNQTMLYMEFLGETQGALIDSVLLTTSTQVRMQDMGTWRLIDERKRAVHGIIQTVSPVLANGLSASVVRVTVLDDQEQPIPNVEIILTASPDRGVRYFQPTQPTDSEGRTWGLVYSDVAEVKNIRAVNMSADSTVLDTFALVSFVVPPGDVSEDTSPPFIYFTTEYGDTDNNIGPYSITSRVVDNFAPRVSLVWTVTGNVYTDTVEMIRVTGTDDFIGEIPGQAYNEVVNYFVMAEDSAGFRVSKPDSLISDPFVLSYRFEILSPNINKAARMGITLTTDAYDLTDAGRQMPIRTWIASTVGIRSALIKWRNLSQGLTFFDVPMSHFGAAYHGVIPAQSHGSRIEYFVQVTDSLGRVERDRRRAPWTDLYTYNILSTASLGEVSFADTTSFLSTGDIRTTRYTIFADLNGDGCLDIVAANYGQANSVYLYNAHAGVFTDVSDKTLGTLAASKTTCVAVADVDADDDLDLIFTNEGEQNRLYLNSGTGTFEDVTLRTFAPSGVPRLPIEEWSSGFVLADDFNGDGSIDLFVANSALGGEADRLLFNDSLGVFRDMTDLYLDNSGPDQSVGAIAGDINGDGYTDIVVVNRARNHLWFRNNGSGLFRKIQITAQSAAQARGGDLGDVDGDGDLDLVVAQSETQQNELFLNNGLGVFSRDTQGRLPPESDNTYAVKFFDADADGCPDLYYANHSQSNRLLLNDGNGFFSEAPAGMMPAWAGSSVAVAVGDVNRDNRPDLYISEQDRRNTLVLSRSENVGSGAGPSEFDLLSPSDEDTVNSVSAVFNWSSSISPDPADPVRYNFVLGSDSLLSPETLVAQYQELTDTTVTVDSLNDNTTYWWKVFAFNSSMDMVSSRGLNSFTALDRGETEKPEFYIILNRNPVFTGFIKIYIVSSLPLAADPALTINRSSVAVERIGLNDIWRAQVYSRSSFLLSVSGTSVYGMAGEYTKAYASLLLASVSASRVVGVPDGSAWITLGTQAAAAGELLIVAQSHEPVRNGKIKAAIASSGLPAGAGKDIEVLLSEGDCYTFCAFGGELDGEVKVSIKGRPPEEAKTGGRDRLAVCRLEQGSWAPLETTFDHRAGCYSTKTRSLGTFALRPAQDKAPGHSSLPRAFMLAQNRPNPFNPSTFISYSVPAGVEKEGAVVARMLSIRVYNLRGGLVRTLVDHAHGPGSYTVEWNGRGEWGRELPSGVYFYRLNSQDINITRKMVLLR